MFTYKVVVFLFAINFNTFLYSTNLLKINFDRLFPYSEIELIDKVNKDTFNTIYEFHNCDKTQSDINKFGQDICDSLIDLNYHIKSYRANVKEVNQKDLTILHRSINNNLIFFDSQVNNLEQVDAIISKKLFDKALQNLDVIKMRNQNQRQGR